MIMLSNKDVIVPVCDVKNSNRAFQQSLLFYVHKNHNYKISKALLPNAPILYFKRNCCNAQVTVSFVTANNFQTLLFIHSSMYTSVPAN